MKEAITSFRGAHRFLSNFAPCRVLYQGKAYPSVENAYQAAKFPHDPHFQACCQDWTPGECKRFSRRGRTPHPDWDEVKLDVMEHLLWQKFALEGYKSALLRTGDAPLIEGNTWGDVFWGVCDGRGANNLGKLLMKIRDKFQSS